MTGRPIDFARLADALLQNAEALVARWLPNGFWRADRWYIGDFDGTPGESANVNLRTGQWIDNGAAEDKGGDLISLYARIHGISNGEAARQLMDELGWVRDDSSLAPRVQTPAPQAPTVAASIEARERPRKTPRWRPIVPVPTHARKARPKLLHGYKDAKQGGAWVELEPVRSWAYEFEGDLYGYVARYERVNSDGEIVKDTIPHTWCEDLERDRGTQRWHQKTWETPRPLYVPATTLSADLSLPVVIVEGEKCAEAGHRLLGHEFDFVSWPGGCKTWQMAAWGWIMGRTVILWPDCDADRERLTKADREAGVEKASKPVRPAHEQPGMMAMVGIGQKLQADHGCTVSICKIPAPGTVAAGWDIADAIEQGWDADKVREFLRGAATFVAPSDEARAKVGAAAAAVADASAGASSSDDASWRSALITAANGTIKPVRENVVLALDGAQLANGRRLPGIPEAAVIAFNDFTNDVIKLRPTPWGSPAGPWEEVDELELGNWLAREHWLPSMSRQTLEEATKMVAFRHRFHPVRERLERLRGTWDNQRRCGRWLAHCCRQEGYVGGKAADPLQQYLARVGTWLLMAIVARVMQPGVKFDYMMILEGGQGMGKSTLCRTLGLDWFADTGLVLGDKDSYQNLQGVLVYEWGELDSLTRAEVTKVKQFISSQKDRFRASFDRRPKDYPRQVVFIGTTNELHYLSDPTGNRRFWPVRVTKFIDLEWLQANLDQLLAEALHYVEAGQRFHPTQDEQRELFDPQQLERTVEDPIESQIRRYLYDEDQKHPFGSSIPNGALVKEISLDELLNRLNYAPDKRTRVLTKQASAAMSRLGWERGRASGRGGEARPWVYRRPAGESGAPAPPPGGGGDPINSSTQSYATEGAEDDCPF